MRTRLTLALVGIVAAALLAAGAGALVVARFTSHRQATNQLLAQGRLFARHASEVRHPEVLQIIRQLLKLEDAELLLIRPSGALVTPIQSHIGQVSLQPLLEGRSISGWNGNLAFVLVPVQLGIPTTLTGAVLLTRQVGNLTSGWLYFLLVAAGAVLVAGLVAEILSGTITRPIREASEATGRIAGGELSARVGPQSIPELDLLGSSINSMAERLQSARERENQLLLSVSHDLRTPLTSIRGYAEAIEEGVAEDPAAAAHVIGTESRRLERLVADLLDLAKLPHLSLNLVPVNLPEVVGAAVDSLRPLAGDRVRLTFESDDARAVWSDADRLTQIVTNLVDNAIGYARSSVAVSVRGTSIQVADDGPGIPAEDLSRVFDRFFQADRGDAARTGSGLGLSIVAELVRAMGGTVQAESPAIGTTAGTRMVVVLRPVS